VAQRRGGRRLGLSRLAPAAVKRVNRRLCGWTGLNEEQKPEEGEEDKDERMPFLTVEHGDLLAGCCFP
jgi:hypothetical protein